MIEQQVPQLTELGEKLAKDPNREALDDLLGRLPNEKNDQSTLGNFPVGSKEEAVRSARHILKTVWSMQHLGKIARKGEIPNRP